MLDNNGCAVKRIRDAPPRHKIGEVEPFPRDGDRLARSFVGCVASLLIAYMLLESALNG